jgi:peptidoglycan hydrolase-like protein with peptidoglycan-binding domain
MPYLQGSPTVSIPLLKVDGRLGRNTWKAWQAALKDLGLFSGIMDGRPGRDTYRAIQKWSGVTADGIIGPITRRAVQKKLGVKEDGIWGRITISALQRALNEGRI